MKLTKNNLILSMILFFGLILRIINLDRESIWLDEGISIKTAMLNAPDMIKFAAWKIIHPPFYSLVLHYWIILFGNSEFYTRFLSVIFAFCAIFLIYRIGSLIFNDKVGLISALLLALSELHIRYSQEVRSYSLITFLSLLSIYFFIKLEKGSIKYSIGYIISSTLLIYTHYYGLFINLAQNIYVFTKFLAPYNFLKINFKNWIKYQAILLVLFLPWIDKIITMLGYLKARPNIESIDKLYSTFAEYAGTTYLLVFFLFLSIFSIITYERAKGDFNWKNIFKSLENFQWKVKFSNVDKIYFLLIVLFTPIIFSFVFSRFYFLDFLPFTRNPIYSMRYTIGSYMALFLLVAKGLTNFRSKYFKLILIGLIISLSLLNVYTYHTMDHKEQWRDVANYLDANAEKGDLLIFNAGYMMNIVFDYYSKRTDLLKKPFPEDTRIVDKENIKNLGKVIKDHDRVWVILSHSGDLNNLIIKTIGESYNMTFQERYIGINLYLFEK